MSDTSRSVPSAPRVGYAYPRNPLLDYVKGPDTHGMCPACKWRQGELCPAHVGYGEGLADGWAAAAHAALLAGIELPPRPGTPGGAAAPAAAGKPAAGSRGAALQLVPVATEKRPKVEPRFEVGQGVLFQDVLRCRITERAWSGIGFVYVAHTLGGKTGLTADESKFTPDPVASPAEPAGRAQLSVVPDPKEGTA